MAVRGGVTQIPIDPKDLDIVAGFLLLELVVNLLKVAKLATAECSCRGAEIVGRDLMKIVSRGDELASSVGPKVDVGESEITERLSCLDAECQNDRKFYNSQNHPCRLLLIRSLGNEIPISFHFGELARQRFHQIFTLPASGFHAVIFDSLRMKDVNIKRWLNHFRNNQRDRVEPSWDAPTRLTDHQIQALLPSLAQFELGDGGGPCYLTAWNREKFLSQPHARELVDLWFREEAEHSRLLGDAVKRFGGKRIESHWSFTIFCHVRKYLGVNFELRTLILTEIVSNVYYQMMLRHGGAKDEAIAQMCRLVIRDETGHIAFHKDRMAGSGRKFGAIWAGTFNVMGLAAGSMLWINHGKAIRALGGTNSEFYQEIWHAMDYFVVTLRKHSESERIIGTGNSDHLQTRPRAVATPTGT